MVGACRRSARRDEFRLRTTETETTVETSVSTPERTRIIRTSISRQLAATLFLETTKLVRRKQPAGDPVAQ